MMIPAATASLAAFTLLTACVCALASARRLALIGVTVALSLALTASAAAVVGQRRYESCAERAARLAPAPLSELEMRRESYGLPARLDPERDRQEKRAGAAYDRCQRGEALGLRSPF